jgi:hypothetical protein
VYVLETIAVIGFLITRPPVILLIAGAVIIIVGVLFFFGIGKLGKLLSDRVEADNSSTSSSNSLDSDTTFTGIVTIRSDRLR